MDKKVFMMDIITRGLFEKPVIDDSEDGLTIGWVSSDHGKSWFKDLADIASTLREIADSLDGNPNAELLGEHDESNYMNWS